MNIPTLINYTKTYEKLIHHKESGPYVGCICTDEKMFLEFIYKPVNIDCPMYLCKNKI